MANAKARDDNASRGFNLKKGALSIGIQKPFFIKGSFSGNEGDIEQRVKVWQLVLSYRSLPI